MKCQNLRHTGLSPYSTAGNSGGEEWRFQTEGRMESGMVIDSDGVIYFGELHDYLYAVYPDGSLKWKYNIDDWIWSTPAIAEDGTVYIGSYDDFLYAINSDGTLKWRFCSRSSISSSPAIDSDGVIYFGNMGWPDGDGCKIFAIYPNGTLKWEYQTGDAVLSSPAIADDGTIYIGSWDSYLYALNPDGTLKWRFKTGDSVKSHPVIADDGTIYFDSINDYLYALNPDGTLKWKVSNGGSATASVALADDGTIYDPGDNYLYAYNPDGTLKWSFFLGSTNFYIGQASPAVSADGTIYIGINAGEIIAVNPDGTELWRKKIGNFGVYSSPCIGSNGEVYIGSSCDLFPDGHIGYLHCFAPQDDNHPPDTPYVDGRPTGSISKEIYISIRGSDPDNNPVSYDVDWGDGTYTYGIYSMDNELGKSYGYHTYSSTGIYNIRVKAWDDFGGESDWGSFKITISKNKNIVNYRPLLNFIDNYPYLVKMLDKIMKVI
jgi:outer membrane protein assembly factor BamB